VDSGYARSHGLTAGSAVAVDQAIYVPLARAQAMQLLNGRLADAVNTIYLTAASAADIPRVSK